MVLGANAVVYPRTVMVEALHATVADVAVPTAWSANHLAVRTKTVCLELLSKYLCGRGDGGEYGSNSGELTNQKVYFLALDEVARLSHPGEQKENYCEGK